MSCLSQVARCRAFAHAALLLAAASAHATDGGAALSLQQAQALALSRSTSIRAASFERDAALEGARSAGVLPDPELAVGIDNLPIDGPTPFSLNADLMTMRRIGLMQELPRGEKRQRQRELARDETALAEAGIAVQRLQLRREVARAWFALHAARDKRAVLAEQDRELGLALSTATSAVGGGAALEPVFELRAERLALADRESERAAEEATGLAELSRFVGAAAQDELAAAPDLLEPAPQAADWAAALEHHPALGSAQAALAVDQDNLALRRAERLPDWTIEVSYAERSRPYDDMLSIGLRIPLPIHAAYRQRPAIAAAQNRLDASAARAVELQGRYRAELEGSAAQYAAARNRLQRIDQQRLPLAEQRLQLAQARYAGGGGELQSALSARRELLNLKFERIERWTELALAWVELSSVTETAP